MGIPIGLIKFLGEFTVYTAGVPVVGYPGVCNYEVQPVTSPLKEATLVVDLHGLCESGYTTTDLVSSTPFWQALA